MDTKETALDELLHRLDLDGDPILKRDFKQALRAAYEEGIEDTILGSMMLRGAAESGALGLESTRDIMRSHKQKCAAKYGGIQAATIEPEGDN